MSVELYLSNNFVRYHQNATPDQAWTEPCILWATPGRGELIRIGTSGGKFSDLVQCVIQALDQPIGENTTAVHAFVHHVGMDKETNSCRQVIAEKWAWISAWATLRQLLCDLGFIAVVIEPKSIVPKRVVPCPTMGYASYITSDGMFGVPSNILSGTIQCAYFDIACKGPCTFAEYKKQIFEAMERPLTRARDAGMILTLVSDCVETSRMSNVHEYIRKVNEALDNPSIPVTIISIMRMYGLATMVLTHGVLKVWST